MLYILIFTTLPVLLLIMVILKCGEVTTKLMNGILNKVYVVFHSITILRDMLIHYKTVIPLYIQRLLLLCNNNNELLRLLLSQVHYIIIRS